MAKRLWISDFKDLDLVGTKIQDRNEARSEIRPTYALDTETDENGNIMLLADNTGRYLELDEITPHNVIKFLFDYRYQGSWNFFYNLTFDAEVILKTLGKILYNFNKTRRLSFKFEDYAIQYIPNKKLAILKDHKSSVFFDIAQYYKESLPNAYLSNKLGILSEDYLLMKTNRDGFTRNYYKRNKKLMRRYCIKDCVITKELVDHWINIFKEAFGFCLARWISSGYLAEKVLINYKIPIPLFSEISYGVQKFAWRCYYGGRFEILKRGLIGHAYLYDINSAYPYTLTKIPDITKGKWIQSKSLSKNALLGFFEIEVDIPDEKYIPPFPFRNNKKLIFPSGRFITYCTLAELQSCRNPEYYTILDSYQYFDDSPEYPYKEFIEFLYEKRLELKRQENPQQLAIKTILNSMYGKMAQRVGNRIGNMFSPIIASTITGMSRAMLYDFVMDHDIEDNVVSFATDSIITTKKIEINSEKLGGFKRENYAEDVYVLQNGIYRFNGEWKNRGIGKLGIKQIEHLETIEKEGNLYPVFDITRVSRLRSSIMSNRIEDIGKFKKEKRRVNLNADRKRLWFEDLKSINDGKMTNSFPISLNYFTKSVL